MNLGRINFLTSKWIDSSGNGNDADLVDGFCARFDGTTTCIRIAHNNIMNAPVSSEWNFRARSGNLSQQGIIAVKATTTTGTMYWSIWYADATGAAGEGIHVQFSDGTNIKRGGFIRDIANTRNVWVDTATLHTFKLTLAADRTIRLWVDGVEFAYISQTDIGVGTLDLSVIGEIVIGKAREAYGVYFNGDVCDFKYSPVIAGTPVLNLPFQGSGLDISGNNFNGVVTNVNFQGTQPNFHYNLQYGCDVYSANSDPTDRALWYYNPYKADGTPAASAAEVATQAGYAVTLLRNCLPYRDDAPLNLSETKIQMPVGVVLDVGGTDYPVYDKSNTDFYEDALRASAYYDATSAETKRTWSQPELNGRYQSSVTKAGYKNIWFCGSYAQVLDASLFALTGRIRALIAYSAAQTGKALRAINKFCHGENY